MEGIGACAAVLLSPTLEHLAPSSPPGQESTGTLQERRDTASSPQQGHRVLGHMCLLASHEAPAHIPVMTPVTLPLPTDAEGS